LYIFQKESDCREGSLVGGGGNRLILIAGLTNSYGSKLHHYSFLMLKCHHLVGEATNEISTKNLKSKSVGISGGGGGGFLGGVFLKNPTFDIKT